MCPKNDLVLKTKETLEQTLSIKNYSLAAFSICLVFSKYTFSSVITVFWADFDFTGHTSQLNVVKKKTESHCGL